MDFDGAKTKQQINESMNAMLLLHSSCQGIIEATIQPSKSSWYEEINRELADAEELVVAWRQNGYLYFQQDILGQITSCGQEFLDAGPRINDLFTRLEQEFSEDLKEEIAGELRKLNAPISGMVSQIGAYEKKLGDFEAAMQDPHSRMNETIARIQAQEEDIQADIAAMNAEIDAMQKQIQTDREAIAKAKKARDRGIVETIFGVLLAPVTGGASLILAGIGVATISEAEAKINDLESGIRRSQKKIAQDQTHLADDKREIVTLKGLSLGLQIALNDMVLIQDSLDPLRTTWDLLDQELVDETNKVSRAKNAQEAIVGQAWFHAACNEWKVIIAQSRDLNQRTISTTRITIGGS